MDWSSVASLLAERSEKPLVLLDKNGRIRLFTSTMEAVLGFHRHEVEGRRWADTCAAPDVAAHTGRWVTEGLRGVLREHEAEAITRDGRRIILVFDVAPIGDGRGQGLMLTVQAVKPARSAQATASCDELEYSIVASPREFGVLRSVRCVSGVVQEAQGACFQQFHNRKAPCPDCPAMNVTRQPWPRIAVRWRSEKADESIEVITAEPADEATIHVRVRRLTARTLTAIHEAKIAALAKDARLSDRERVVLEYLLMGRSLDDIATILGLSRRTVKFHQANILEKLGADSRVDLVRLTGF